MLTFLFHITINLYFLNVETNQVCHSCINVLLLLFNNTSYLDRCKNRGHIVSGTPTIL